MPICVRFTRRARELGSEAYKSAGVVTTIDNRGFSVTTERANW